MANRIHIFGASGVGSTSLGSLVASRLQVPHLDVDDYYWKRTDPPFTQKNSPEQRVASIIADMQGHDSWVLSGSLVSWGKALEGLFTLAVFLRLDPAIRMERLRERERQRYGSRVLPTGDMYEQHLEFLEWAASYDTASPPIRSVALHEEWIEQLPCSTLRLNSAQPPEELADAVLEQSLAES
ncbi:adenylate kinase [Billgrantia antri]|uniref:Adenylate kinase n=1 Tax=Halomonas sulfidivorans TaxID=2733488 RepID=A0ABX7WDV4_9GAMM|nr:AAA family ATPase [Halomonas sulfidivorans]QTP58310.1 adenylate kinase [Halomonas sulfidivorans]